MRKIVLSTVGIGLVGGLLCTPYITGMRAETTVLKVLQDESQGPWKFSAKDYHRGWFHSEAVILAKLERPSGVSKIGGQTQAVPFETFEFESKVNIVHGPILFGKGGLGIGMAHMTGNLTLSGNLKTALLKLVKTEADLPHLDIDARIGLNDSLNLSILHPKFSLKNPSGPGEFVWDGMQIQTQLNGDQSQSHFNWKIGAFEYSDPSENKLFAKISAFELGGFASKTLDSNFYMNFPGFSMGDQQSSMTLQNLKLDLKTKATGKALNGEIAINLEKYQPNIANNKLFSGDLKIEFKNFDTDAMKELQGIVESANNPSNNELQRAQSGMMILMALPKLFSQGAEISIPVGRVVTPEGNASLTGAFSMAKQSGMMTPLALLTQSKAKLELTFPKQALIQILSAYYIDEAKKEDSAKSASQTDSTESTGSRLGQALTSGSKDASEASSTPVSVPNEAEANQHAESQIQQWVSNGYLENQNQVMMAKLTFENGELQINGKKVQLNP